VGAGPAGAGDNRPVGGGDTGPQPPQDNVSPRVRARQERAAAKAAKAAKKSTKAGPEDIGKAPKSGGAAAASADTTFTPAKKSKLATALHNYTNTVKRSFKSVGPVASTVTAVETRNTVKEAAAQIAFTAGGELHFLAGLHESEPLKKIANMFSTEAGTFGEKGEGSGHVARDQRSYNQAVDIEHVTDANTLTRIFRSMTDGTHEEGEANLAKFEKWMRNPDQIPKSTTREDPVFNAVQEAKDWLGRKHDYLKEAGVDIGDAGRDYYPRQIDAVKVMNDQPGFESAAADQYREVYRREQAQERADFLAQQGNDRQAAEEANQKTNAWHQKMLADAKASGDTNRVKLWQSKIAAEAKDITSKRARFATQREAFAKKQAKDAEGHPERAQKAAQTLADAVVLGDEYTGHDFHKTTGPEQQKSSFIKARLFGDTENTPLAEFYHDDPIRNLMNYALRSVKRAEAARRFGPNNERWAELMNQVRDDKVPLDTQKRFTRVVQTIMGENASRSTGDRRIDAGLNALGTMSTMGMLDKAVFASLAETIQPALRTGNPLRLATSIPRTVYEMVKEALNRNNPSELRQLAEQLGIVENTHLSSVIAQLHSHGALEYVQEGSERMKNRFFRANALTQLTNAQKVAATGEARYFLNRHTQRWKTSAASRNYLRELGVPDDKMEEFANWLQDPQRAGSPFDHEFGPNSSEEAKIYQTAAHTFARQAIVEPKGADRPAWMSSVGGKLAGQFTSFNWATGKNIIMRQLRLLYSAVNLKNGYSLKDRAGALASPLFTAASMYMAASMVGWLRAKIFEDERRNREKNTSTQQFMQNLSQSGLLAGFEPLVSAYFGFNPNRPLGTLAPPAANLILQPIQKQIQYYWSEKDPHGAERARARSWLSSGDAGINMLATAPFVPAWLRVPAVFASEFFRAQAIDAMAGPETPKEQEADRARRLKLEPKPGTVGGTVAEFMQHYDPSYLPPQSQYRP
jgi:hypothetical protein